MVSAKACEASQLGLHSWKVVLSFTWENGRMHMWQRGRCSVSSCTVTGFIVASKLDIALYRKQKDALCGRQVNPPYAAVPFLASLSCRELTTPPIPELGKFQLEGRLDSLWMQVAVEVEGPDAATGWRQTC